MKQILKIRFLSFFVSIFFLSSCITNRNLEYINTDNVKIESTTYDYIIQKEDLLSVQISSTTKSEYDFFNLQETSNPQLMNQNPYLYGFLVKSDGIITLPMIGSLKAEGLWRLLMLWGPLFLDWLIRLFFKDLVRKFVLSVPRRHLRR